MLLIPCFSSLKAVFSDFYPLISPNIRSLILQKLACGPSRKKCVLVERIRRPRPTRRNLSAQFFQRGCHPNQGGDQHTELLINDKLA